MLRARKYGVLTPVVYFVEHEASAIYMQRIHGCTVKAALLEGKLSETGKTLMQSMHACMHAREISCMQL